MENTLNKKKRLNLAVYFIFGFLIVNVIIPIVLSLIDVEVNGFYIVLMNLPVLFISILMYKWSTYNTQIRTISLLLVILSIVVGLIDTSWIPYPYAGFLVLGLLLFSFVLLLFSLNARGELIYTRFSTFLAISMGLIIFQRAFFDLVVMIYNSDLISGDNILMIFIIGFLFRLSIFLLQLAALDAVYQEKLEFFD